MSDSKYYFLMVRTVAAGHRMVTDGWALFEEAIEGAGEGDLPQLLHHLRGVTTSTPPPQQSLAPIDVPQMMTPTPLPVKKIKTENVLDQPVVVMVGGGSCSWACPQCNMVRGSKNGCDAHIQQVYTGKALVCALCSFSTYNMDSLQRHEKEHNWSGDLFYFNFNFDRGNNL